MRRHRNVASCGKLGGLEAVRVLVSIDEREMGDFTKGCRVSGLDGCAEVF